ncbi:MAG: IPT/TIG domain-containing protein [Candidatus Marinimicrobia bacterium]|nr:IPT/TIG domain-containing protein [Candidatus Neomarinimicrobiota bacterium]
MQKYFLSTLLIILLVLSVSCENDYPASVYDPDELGAPNPEITSVDPPNESFEGIGVVTINGNNFASEMHRNLVFFNAQQATLLEDQSNDSKLVVKVPIVIGDEEITELDSVTIRVAVTGDSTGKKGSYEYGTYSPYKIIKPAVDWGGFKLEAPKAAACDAEENIYVVTAEKNVYKIDPTGQKTLFNTITISTASGMKVGWNGDLFITVANRPIFTVNENFSGLFTALGGKVYDLDFDPDSNMYAVGEGVFAVKANQSNMAVGHYDDFVLGSVKVYDSYLYVSGEYVGASADTAAEGVWKSEILDAEGNLGQKEEVFNWAEYVGEDGPRLESIAIDENGVIYMGSGDRYDTDYIRDDAIIKYDPATDEAQPFRSEVLYTPASYLCWGTGNYLYIVRNTTSLGFASSPGRTVIRTALSTGGAHYYGREF